MYDTHDEPMSFEDAWTFTEIHISLHSQCAALMFMDMGVFNNAII